MRQYTQKEFIRILVKNGYLYSRHSGSHAIYVKDGNHISVPRKPECVILRRLIKENNIITKFK